MLYAGVIAEATNSEGGYNHVLANREWKTGGGQNDYAKIRELTHVLRNIKFPLTVDNATAQSELDQIDSELLEKSGYLVQDRITLIHGIGDSLFHKIKKYDETYALTESELNRIPMVRDLYGGS